MLKDGSVHMGQFDCVLILSTSAMGRKTETLV